jgi:hypothetical protein
MSSLHRQRGFYSAKGSPRAPPMTWGKFIARDASPAISLILVHNCSVVPRHDFSGRPWNSFGRPEMGDGSAKRGRASALPQ